MGFTVFLNVISSLKIKLQILEDYLFNILKIVLLSKECIPQPWGEISANGARLAHCEIGTPPTQSVRMSRNTICWQYVFFSNFALIFLECNKFLVYPTTRRLYSATCAQIAWAEPLSHNGQVEPHWLKFSPMAGVYIILIVEKLYSKIG